MQLAYMRARLIGLCTEHDVELAHSRLKYLSSMPLEDIVISVMSMTELELPEFIEEQRRFERCG